MNRGIIALFKWLEFISCRNLNRFDMHAINIPKEGRKGRMVTEMSAQTSPAPDRITGQRTRNGRSLGVNWTKSDQIRLNPTLKKIFFLKPTPAPCQSTRSAGCQPAVSPTASRQGLNFPASLKTYLRIALLLSALLCAASSARSQPTETQFLSGHDKDDAVPWEFMCTSGANSGYWTNLPVP